ncbi:Hpc2-related domain [Macleaya cordata]|uniref:Hpc2-related domain n=1 Tax=Macleaya cordata TaxID=56857 RepID=A0A200PZL1_MACCD|nr:Hpc2-related domain [Macleaya cordata]
MEVEEEIGGGGGSSSRVSPSSLVTSSAAAAATKGGGGRQRFTVELRPGETTFVSWKKLIKEDSNKNKPSNNHNNNNPTSLPPATDPPPTGAHPALESRIAPPGQNSDCEMKDAPPSNRFSAVIEKIERLYMGKQSSDEEELDDIPDDDQYDTEDSFIDDAELDQYFQVDKSTTKHNGFFVNRGKLERINEHVSSPNIQPKKRRRKDLTRTSGEKDAEQLPNKHAKMGNVRMKAAARTAPFAGNKVCSPSHSLATVSDHFHDGKSQERLNASIGSVKKKFADSKVKVEQSLASKNQIANASACPVEVKDTEKQKAIVVQSKDLGNKLKVASDALSNAHQIYRDSSASIQLEPQSRKLLNDTNELELSPKVQQRRKDGSSELLEHQIRRVKSTSMHVKEGSSVRSKGTMLERAIRELELIVSESRPPSAETQDADISFPGIKRRLPREVKQKLAKVARLAQSSQGKISEELIHRLMSILGHTVQLKTLKRNLKAMVELGLSAKQEKDDRFQQIKKEVIEMIRAWAPSLKSKAFEQQDGTSDDFREAMDSKEKGLPKGTYSMDDAMEDKICDLYDLYVEGMDEDKGPQIRKLYVELAELWPNGMMDNHGIKNAVCRAKERKRALYGRHKDKEKIRRKKLSSTPRMEEMVSGEASSIAQQSRTMVDRMVSENNADVLTSTNKMTSNQKTAHQQNFSTTDRNILSSVTVTKSSTSTDWLKQEKVKCSSSTFLDKARKTLDGVLKQKVKRKSESDSGDNNNCPPPPEKLSSQQQEGKERHKSSHKQVVVSSHSQKSSLQSSSGLQGSQQPSS